VGEVVELDPPPQPIAPSIAARMADPKSNNLRSPTPEEKPLFLPRVMGKHKSQTNPHAALAKEKRIKRAADCEPTVRTFTLKVAVLPPVRERDDGVTLQVAFTGACVQLNITVPLELEPDTTDSE
jgi:hypothetical protein